MVDESKSDIGDVWIWNLLLVLIIGFEIFMDQKL